MRRAYLLYTCASVDGVRVVSFWVVGTPMGLIMRYKAGLAYLSSLYQDIGCIFQPDERRAQAVGKDKDNMRSVHCFACHPELDTLVGSQYGNVCLSK